VTEVSLQGNVVRFSPVSLRESQEMRMHRLHPRSVWKATVSTISVPRPGRPGEPVRDVPLLEWARSVLMNVLGEPPAAVGAGAAGAAAPVGSPAASA
jgi:transcription-repair coupling factor (superfamily II helicase)